MLNPRPHTETFFLFFVRPSQIASQKMLNLERTIEKHRGTMTGDAFQELKDCVTQDPALVSPNPRGRQPQQQQR